MTDTCRLPAVSLAICCFAWTLGAAASALPATPAAALPGQAQTVGESFGIEATNTRKLVDRLQVGTWQDLVQRPPNQPDGWTLKVVRKIQ